MKSACPRKVAPLKDCLPEEGRAPEDRLPAEGGILEGHPLRGLKEGSLCIK